MQQSINFANKTLTSEKKKIEVETDWNKAI